MVCYSQTPGQLHALCVHLKPAAAVLPHDLPALRSWYAQEQHSRRLSTTSVSHSEASAALMWRCKPGGAPGRVAVALRARRCSRSDCAAMQAATARTYLGTRGGWTWGWRGGRPLPPLRPCSSRPWRRSRPRPHPRRSCRRRQRGLSPRRGRRRTPVAGPPLSRRRLRHRHSSSRSRCRRRRRSRSSSSSSRRRGRRSSSSRAGHQAGGPVSPTQRRRGYQEVLPIPSRPQSPLGGPQGSQWE